jgi:GNAT superfamily N-acetyltransferase
MAKPRPEGIETREAGPPDAAAIAHLVRAGFATWEWAGQWRPNPVDVEEDEIAEWLAKPGMWCLLATADGVPAGQATLSPAYTEEEPQREIPGLCHLRHLFLAPEWHGTGLAVHLLDAAMDHARAVGYTRARLWTPRDNERARAFYGREGWRESGVERPTSRFGLPLIQLVRDLP